MLSERTRHYTGMNRAQAGALHDTDHAHNASAHGTDVDDSRFDRTVGRQTPIRESHLLTPHEQALRTSAAAKQKLLIVSSGGVGLLAGSALGAVLAGPPGLALGGAMGALLGSMAGVCMVDVWSPFTRVSQALANATDNAVSRFNDVVNDAAAAARASVSHAAGLGRRGVEIVHGGLDLAEGGFRGARGFFNTTDGKVLLLLLSIAAVAAVRRRVDEPSGSSKRAGD